MLGVRQDADALTRGAQAVKEAARNLGERSIGQVLEGTQGWHDKNPFTYLVGDLPMTHDDLYDPARWERLSETEARERVEQESGVDLLELREAKAALVRRARLLRTEVLARLEPLAQQPSIAYVQPQIQETRDLQIELSVGAAVEHLKPSHFILSDVETKIGSPLHVANAAEGLSAGQTARLCVELVDKLTSVTTSVEHALRASAPQAPDEHEVRESPEVVAASAEPVPSAEAPSAPVSPSAEEPHHLVGWLIFSAVAAVFAAGFAAVLDAGWIPGGSGSAVAKSFVVVLLVLLLWALATHLLPGRTFALLVKVLGVSLAVFGVAIAIVEAS